MDKETVILDVLDIMYSGKRGYTIADLLMQLNNIYQTRGKKIEQQELYEILNELTEKGYLRMYKVGLVDGWKITEEGIDYFEGL